MNNLHFVYVITNTINYKVYVGQTIDPYNRWSAHRCQAKREVLQYAIYKAIRKYGIDSFQFCLIEICKSQSEADLSEIYWIDKFDSRNNESGYNLAVGGNVNTGWHHTEESKRKISQSQKGKIVVISEETKNKISAANMGHSVSDETRKKISKGNKGISRTEETKILLSKIKTGTKLSEDTKNKMSISQSNRQKLSDGVCNLSKLTPNLVKQIRQEWSEKLLSQRKLAERYNVDRMTIWRIVNYKIWKNS